ncbi:hypothetical protein Tco_1328726 [Tanacetum coccineum]
MWEEFIQAIQSFLTNKANLGSPTKKGRKDKAHVIPYCRFTKLIICHLGRTHNIHQRSASLFHLAEEDLRLGNLKFVPKGEEDEVFGMPIPNELISNNIMNASYYDAYLEMVAKHDQKIAAEKGERKKPTTAKQPKPKPAKEKPSKPTLALKPKAQSQAHVGGVAIQEPVAEATRPFPVVEGKEKAIATDEQAAQSLLALHTPKRRSTTDQFIFQRQTPATEEASTGPSAQPQDDTSANIVRESPSLADAETSADTDKTNSRGNTKILQIGEEQGDDVANVNRSSKFNGDSLFNEESGGCIHDWGQFLNEKSTEDELGKLNVKAEVVSMVTVPIYQASSSVPPLSTPVIDFSPPKPGFTLELWDLPHKINQTVNEVVKQAVHVALQALLRDRFRELLETDMKEILHQRMFESGTYKSLPKHVALNEALEVSMERAQRDKFFAEKDKSRKRRRDDQDPPPLPPDSDLNKKKRHDSDASGSSQPPAPQLSS